MTPWHQTDCHHSLAVPACRRAKHCTARCYHKSLASLRLNCINPQAGVGRRALRSRAAACRRPNKPAVNAAQDCSGSLGAAGAQRDAVL